MAKLNSADRTEIIKLFKEGYSMRLLAKQFQVSPTTIGTIIRNYLNYGDYSLQLKRVGKTSFKDISPEEKEINRLNKEIKNLKEADEIRKKFLEFLENQEMKETEN